MDSTIVPNQSKDSFYGYQVIVCNCAYELMCVCNPCLSEVLNIILVKIVGRCFG